MRRILLIAALFGATTVLAEAARANEIAGAIDANGLRQVKSQKYLVKHPSVGRYIITFTTPFPAPYASCFFMSVEAAVPSGLIERTTSCDVTFVNKEGKLANTIFNFLAVDTTP